MNDTKPSIKPLYFLQSITLGCDPELFFVNKDGSAVGSEKIIPTDGINVAGNYGTVGKCIIDGVQAEINPTPSSCRESLAWAIHACFIELQKSISKDNNIQIAAKSVVNISQEELNSLSEGSRVFGCAPSTNIYNEGEDKTSQIKVDPKKYLKRSAGGHLHLGNHYAGYLKTNAEDNAETFYSSPVVAKRLEKCLKEMPDVMVRMLDLIVGNTSVLIDRDPENAERRKNYGRAGEYRIKPYGLEYRTLSNFWLRSYPVFSLVFGLARFAVHLVEQSMEKNNYVKAFFDAVPQADVIKAIQENDFDLAYQNFKKIEDLILIAAHEGDLPNRYYPIKGSTIKYFHNFVQRIKEHGIEYWFKDDALTHWTNKHCSYDKMVPSYNKDGGWETWLINSGKKDMMFPKKELVNPVLA